MPSGTVAGETRGEAFEDFVSALSERDRRNVRRHVDALHAEPTGDHAALWKRLACTLAGLTNRSAKTTGTRAVQFFAADGAYQMQMFALEDLRDGAVAVYAPDAVAAAEAAGVLRGPVAVAGHSAFYQVAGVPGLNIDVEVLSAATTVDAPEYYRHLLGWNRRALRVTLRNTATEAQVAACEALCRLAAREAAAGAAPRHVPAAEPVPAAGHDA
jgi:hypothetical protein